MQRTYKIGEVAAILNVKTHVLRFWESEFSQLVPLRTEKGQRLYTEEHVQLLWYIQDLLHNKGLTLEGARRVLQGADKHFLESDITAKNDTPQLIFDGSFFVEKSKNGGERPYRKEASTASLPFLAHKTPQATYFPKSNTGTIAAEEKKGERLTSFTTARQGHFFSAKEIVFSLEEVLSLLRKEL